MNILIREASLDDIELLWKLNKEELGYDYDLKRMKERLKYLLSIPSNKILVALINEEIVGYVHGGDYDLFYSNHMKNIMGIAVSEKHQRKGIGRLLIKEIEKWAKNTGAVGVRLNSGANRILAHEFYLSCGYELKKEQKNFFKNI